MLATLGCLYRVLAFRQPVVFASGLTGTIYGRLQDSGFFFDPVQREIEQQVMPWLKEETEKIVARHATARCLLLHKCTSTCRLYPLASLSTASMQSHQVLCEAVLC